MRTPLELSLARHGETTYSATERVAGWSDPPLTDNGRRQAEALRAAIDGRQFAGVWSSDLGRAIESVRLDTASRRSSVPRCDQESGVERDETACSADTCRRSW